MRINRKLLDIELARSCKKMSDLRGEGLSPQTLVRINRGESVKPVTVGKIAKALGVDPMEIIKMED
jgi:DNA-binding Xre family transcriptional regulator